MGLRKDLLDESVSELEWRRLIEVHQGDNVREVIARMRREHLGCVVVLDDQEKPIVKFTERDLIRMLVNSPDALDDPVGQHLAEGWGAVREDESISRIVQKMDQEKLRFVIVTDEHHTPIALTGQKGLMEYVVDHFPRRVKVQMMDSKLHMDQREGG